MSQRSKDPGSMPAFPKPDWVDGNGSATFTAEGIDVRTWLAGQVLANYDPTRHGTSEASVRAYAASAVALANATLSESMHSSMTTGAAEKMLSRLRTILSVVVAPGSDASKVELIEQHVRQAISLAEGT